MDAVGRKRNCVMVDGTDTSATLPGKRDRAMDVATETSGNSPANQERRCRMSDLHRASIVAKKIVRGREQWRGPGMKPRWDANHAAPEEGVNATISASAAGERNRFSGKALTQEADKLHGGRESAAKERELSAWMKPKVSKPVERGALPNSASDTRCAPRW